MYSCEAPNSCAICSLSASANFDIAATLPLAGKRRAVPRAGPSSRFRVAVRSVGARLRLDRLPELDLPRLLLGRLRDADLEDAVAVGRSDLRLVDALWKPDCTAEAAVAALEAVVALVRGLLRLLPLGRHRQRVVLDLDRDLVLRDSGEIERVDDGGVRLAHIQRRRRA